MCYVNTKLMSQERGLGLWNSEKKSSVRGQTWRGTFPCKASECLIFLSDHHCLIQVEASRKRCLEGRDELQFLFREKERGAITSRIQYTKYIVIIECVKK